MKKLICAVFAALILCCIPVYADDAVAADIKVKANETITVEIIPMGQSSGSKRIIDREGTVKLSFVKPGEYSYRIRQVGKEGNGVDLSVYHVHVTVVEDENGMVPAVSVYKAGEQTKQAEIIFINEHEPEPTVTPPESPGDPTPTADPTPGPTVSPTVKVPPYEPAAASSKTVQQGPKTGDETNMWIYGVMAAAAAGCILAAFAQKRRDEK